ncbi:hypothetical protein [Methanocella arvoryzae]|nr:hypothetical protein [Methanocella arvoryzae]
MITGCTGSQVVSSNSDTQPSQQHPIYQQLTTPTPTQAPTVDPTIALRQNALSDYQSKISIVSIEQQSLDNYVNTPYTYVDLNDYKTWIDNYNIKASSYQQKCYDAISSGNIYLQYLTVGNDEYNRVKQNEATFSSNIQIYNNNYNQFISDYNKKKATNDAYNNYESKLRVVQSTSQDLQDYVNSSTIFSALSSSYIEGFNTKVTAYATACDNAVYAGQEYQKFLDPGSTAYNQVSSINTELTNSAAELRKTNEEVQKDSSYLSALTSLIKILPMLAV